MKKDKIILWVNSLMNGPHHDNGAFLFVWDKYIGINSERLDREKYSCWYKYKLSKSWVRILYEYDRAQACIDYCMMYFWISYSDIDLLVYLEWIPEVVRNMFPDIQNFQAIHDHHLTHVYSSFFNSPFEDATVLVVDGQGKKVQNSKDVMVLQSIYKASCKEWVELLFETLWQDHMKIGVWTMYEMVTRLLKLWSEGTTMWLSSYSESKKVLEEDLLQKQKNNMYINPLLLSWIPQDESKFLKREVFLWQLGLTETCLELDKIPYGFSSQLSSQLQFETEEALLDLVHTAYDMNPSKNLCIVWGVWLNSVANTKILNNGPFDNVFILPSTDDSGLALWCAMYGRQLLYWEDDTFRVPNYYFWRDYSDNEIKTALNKYSDFCSYALLENIFEPISDSLSNWKVIWWFQGKSESWPRALWNRSILADPRSTKIRDRVNEIKKREWWRPLAPVVLAERLEDYFEISKKSESYKYMLMVVGVKKEVYNIIPWVTHIDKTARVQSLFREDNQKLYTLIENFWERTGVPILINTSFNAGWEPMVETPEEALYMFLSTDIDILVLGNYIIQKDRVYSEFKFQSSIVLQDKLFDNWKWEIDAYEEFLKSS